jgi:hypothetical protein
LTYCLLKDLYKREKKCHTAKEKNKRMLWICTNIINKAKSLYELSLKNMLKTKNDLFFSYTWDKNG